MNGYDIGNEPTREEWRTRRNLDCPECGSNVSNLVRKFVECTSDDYAEGWECPDCGAKWVEVYKFDHIEKGEW